MADQNKNISEFDSAEVDKETAPAVAPASKEPKAKKKQDKDIKPNFFVRVGSFFARIWKKLVKLCKDTAGELKKVTWTPKAEVFKSFKLVLFTIVAVGVAIAVVDVASSWIINLIAGLIG